MKSKTKNILLSICLLCLFIRLTDKGEGEGEEQGSDLNLYEPQVKPHYSSSIKNPASSKSSAAMASSS